MNPLHRLPPRRRRGVAVSLASLFVVACSARSAGTNVGFGVDAGVAEAGAADVFAPGDGGAPRVYTRCEPDAVCAPGTACISALVSGDGMIAGHCSAPCARGEDCPPTAAGTPAAVCVRSGNAGQCHAGCAGNADCAGGMVCGEVPDASVRLCVPSGGAAGSLLRAPYQRCVAGERCADSACAPANIRVADAPVGSFCAARCDINNAAACPGHDPRAASPTVVCVAVGSAEPQCHRTCVLPTDCARDGTVCVDVTDRRGEAVRVCVPRG
ncbi:MAG: hypothetical protein U0325_00945 [Polyangiales bacterium]